MSDVYFVNISVDLVRPRKIINAKGERKEETMREFRCSLPIRDLDRAKTMLDYFAARIAQAFKEVESDQADRQDVTAGSRNLGGDPRPGDELQIAVAPSAEIAGPGGESRDNVGLDLPKMPDGESGAEATREEA